MIGWAFLLAYCKGLAEGAGHAVGFVLTLIALCAGLFFLGRHVARIWNRTL